MSKVLEKIKKKLEKLDSLHAKEEALIESIKDMISDEDDDWDDKEE
jgi:cell division protein FtsB